MRPGFFTLRRLLLLLAAVAVFGGFYFWQRAGMPLPGGGVPSTAGKLAFISTRGGHADLWMMNGAASGTGAPGAEAVALTNDAAEDSEPVWAQNGSEIAFTSAKRTGDTHQIFYMDARPGARVLPLTNTSATKAAPFFGPERRIFYLASGRLMATNPENKDSDLIFPEADTVRALYGESDFPGLLSTGGVLDATTADGAAIAVTIKTEEGQALLLIDAAQNAGALIGAGKRIYAHFLPDGKLLAVYVKGDSMPKMLGLFDEKSAKAGTSVPTIEALFGKMGYVPPAPDGSNVVVYDLSSGTIQKVGELPLLPDGFALSPDGSRFVVSFDKPIPGGQGGTVGLIAFPTTPTQSDAPAVLYPEAAAQPSFSPDGGEIAFVSGKDIFVVPAAGGEAKNLTNGQGENSAPVWSPAKKAEGQNTGQSAASTAATPAPTVATEKK